MFCYAYFLMLRLNFLRFKGNDLICFFFLWILKNGQGRTVACSIHERLKYGVIHYTTSKSLASQLPLSVFINRFWFCSLLYSLPGSWCLNSVLTAFSLSIERCSVYLGFWTVMVFVLFWCNF